MRPQTCTHTCVHVYASTHTLIHTCTHAFVHVGTQLTHVFINVPDERCDTCAHTHSHPRHSHTWVGASHPLACTACGGSTWRCWSQTRLQGFLGLRRTAGASCPRRCFTSCWRHRGCWALHGHVSLGVRTPRGRTHVLSPSLMRELKGCTLGQVPASCGYWVGHTQHPAWSPARPGRLVSGQAGAQLSCLQARRRRVALARTPSWTFAPETGFKGLWLYAIFTLCYKQRAGRGEKN